MSEAPQAIAGDLEDVTHRNAVGDHPSQEQSEVRRIGAVDPRNPSALGRLDRRAHLAAQPRRDVLVVGVPPEERDRERRQLQREHVRRDRVEDACDPSDARRVVVCDADEDHGTAAAVAGVIPDVLLETRIRGFVSLGEPGVEPVGHETRCPPFVGANIDATDVDARYCERNI